MDIRNEHTHAHRGSRRRLADGVRIALAAAALAISLGAQLPAFAFNPQPEPPGMCAPGAPEGCGGPTQ